MKRNFLAAAVAGAITLLIGVPTQAQNKEIVIGVATAMTGAGAATGRQVASGVQQAAKEINEAGGIKGAKVKVIVEDDRSAPGGTVNAFNKLLAEQPTLIVGPTWTTFMTTLAPIIRRAGVPVMTSAIGASPTNPEVSGGWIFRTAPTDITLASSLVDYTLKEIKPKQPAIMTPNDEYGRGALKLFKQAFEKAGIKFVAEETFNQGDKDVSAQVLKIKSTKPDVLILWPALPADAALLINQVRQLGIEAKLIGSPGMAVDEFGNLAKQGADGITTITAWVPNITPEAKAWAGRMKQTDPEAMITFTSVENYDGAMIAFKALASANGLDPASVRKALAATKDHKGIVGSYSFDDRGDGLHTANVVRWEGGQMRPISTRRD